MQKVQGSRVRGDPLAFQNVNEHVIFQVAKSADGFETRQIAPGAVRQTDTPGIQDRLHPVIAGTPINQFEIVRGGIRFGLRIHGGEETVEEFLPSVAVHQGRGS